MFDSSIYDDSFFKWHFDNTREYIINTMSWYMKEYKPKSIVDFGCGIGFYLEVGLSMGAEKVLGFDIMAENAIKYANPVVSSFIKYGDCSEFIDCGKYDCVISIETGEHIDPNKKDGFIKNIVSSLNDGGMVLFTAAPPGQGGRGHINCKPKVWWVNEFKTVGLQENFEQTIKVSNAWKKLGAPDYIIENLIIFEKK